MSKKHKIQPQALFADQAGNIFDHPEQLMVCRKGGELTLPRPDELIPLPEGSELFLLPGRSALGFDPDSGRLEAMEETAVAAFVSPGHTLSAVAAYTSQKGAPRLPLFAYASVGYADGRFYVAAKKVDQDRRQDFSSIRQESIARGAERLMKKFPENRLVRHLSRCALTYSCPAAKNLALGRFEAPLPTSRICNARCVGCISLQPDDSGFPATQERIAFSPSPEEICEIMLHHASVAKKPVYSFGQGCEGEPLTEADRIAKAVALFRERGGTGTVNVNTNASLPEGVAKFARAGGDSIRVSLNSAREAYYTPYYRPKSFVFSDVIDSIDAAKAGGLFVSLNYLFFPGVSDTEGEYEALAGLIADHKVDFVQLRNLNLDPEIYLDEVVRAPEAAAGPSPMMGLGNFMKRLKKACPWLGFGYFNPYLGDERG